MNRDLRLYCWLAVCVLALGGCASGMRFAELKPDLGAGGKELGRIFVYRPSTLGAAVRPDVLLNGQKIGEAISKGFFYVDRPPGEYELTTTTEVTRKVSFVLGPGQTRFIRLSVSFGFFVGHVYGELVDQDVGLSQIQRCKYTGGKEPATR